MKKALDARMRAIEAKADYMAKYAPVHIAIRRQMFYDEMPENWRDLYCEFIGFDRCIVEDVMQMVLGDLHFHLRDVKDPTIDELQKIIDEVEQTISNAPPVEIC
jgi:hypothetical protein